MPVLGSRFRRGRVLHLPPVNVKRNECKQQTQSRRHDSDSPLKSTEEKKAPVEDGYQGREWDEEAREPVGTEGFGFAVAENYEGWSNHHEWEQISHVGCRHEVDDFSSEDRQEGKRHCQVHRR